MPAVEGYGVEPIPDELRTVGWRDLFAINFTFFLNPVMYVLGALAVVAAGLPLPWAITAAAVGQALAYVVLVIVAQTGTDYGLPGQVAMRASLEELAAGDSPRLREVDLFTHLLPSPFASPPPRGSPQRPGHNRWRVQAAAFVS